MKIKKPKHAYQFILGAAMLSLAIACNNKKGDDKKTDKDSATMEQMGPTKDSLDDSTGAPKDRPTDPGNLNSPTTPNKTN